MAERDNSAKANNTAAPRQAPLSKLIARAAQARLMMSRQGLTPSAALNALKALPANERAALQSILYLTERRRALTARAAQKLLNRPPQPFVLAVIETALALIFESAYSDFTIVNQAVNAVRADQRAGHLSGLVNAVLRRALRERIDLVNSLSASEEVRFNAPHWWIERIKAEHPDCADAILTENTKHPPMTLRVNVRRTSVESYLNELKRLGIPARRIGPQAVLLETPRRVDDIPGFRLGLVSVQDAAPQMAAHLLSPAKGARVLDACAAPGGKTAHLLECFDCCVTALEIDPLRAKLIDDTLSRLGLSAEVAAADASDLTRWYQGEPFDSILLDAPCTASGIVRRQPDVPWMRRPEDIKKLARTQQQLLETLWTVLKPGGRLLFCTCSIFAEEGSRQVENFLKRHSDAETLPIGPDGAAMMTLIPTSGDGDYPADGADARTFVPPVHDGFFYALFEKH